MPTTVVRRTIRSAPHRDALTTWKEIIRLLTPSANSQAKPELESVSGIASSCIADHAPESAPIVVTCDGPRTRIYCSYDQDAIDGSESNEEPLGFDPLCGNWAISIPCNKADLVWVQAALTKKSTRITARDKDADAATSEQSSKAAVSFEIDPKGFLEL